MNKLDPTDPSTFRVTTDAHGIEVIHVPLTNAPIPGAAAQLHKTTFESLPYTVQTAPWYVSANVAHLATLGATFRKSVTVKAKDRDSGEPILIARLIVGARGSRRVLYKNGNRVDLRLPNLDYGPRRRDSLYHGLKFSRRARTLRKRMAQG
ncbi:MAG: hypothetical protein AB7I34_05055 [Rhizobiaceae bacterium]